MGAANTEIARFRAADRLADAVDLFLSGAGTPGLLREALRDYWDTKPSPYLSDAELDRKLETKLV